MSLWTFHDDPWFQYKDFMMRTVKCQCDYTISLRTSFLLTFWTLAMTANVTNQTLNALVEHLGCVNIESMRVKKLWLRNALWIVFRRRRICTENLYLKSAWGGTRFGCFKVLKSFTKKVYNRTPCMNPTKMKTWTWDDIYFLCSFVLLKPICFEFE